MTSGDALHKDRRQVKFIPEKRNDENRFVAQRSRRRGSGAVDRRCPPPLTDGSARPCPVAVFTATRESLISAASALNS